MASASRAWLVVLALLSACAAPSEEEIEAEFDDFVASRNQCQVASDCELAPAGCPLGCSVAVRREHVDAVSAKAQELIADFESDGRSCAYRCALVPPLECRMERCFAGP
jgi:hypothetical protein